MNLFDGFLPPPRPTAPVSLDGPAAALEAGLARRRTRTRNLALATGATTLAVALLGALSPRDSQGLRPVRPIPSASPTTTPTSTPSAGPRAPRPANGSAPLSATATATAGSPTVAPASPAGPPRTSAPLTNQSGWTPVTRTFVTDPDPGNNCNMEYGQPGVVICTRTFAPPSLHPRQPASFVFQACAAMDRDQTVHFTGSVEVMFRIIDDAEDGGPTYWTSHPDPSGPGAHDVTIPAGQCAQYTAWWDGLTTSGDPLAPGNYLLLGQLTAPTGLLYVRDDPFTVT